MVPFHHSGEGGRFVYSNLGKLSFFVKEIVPMESAIRIIIKKKSNNFLSIFRFQAIDKGKIPLTLFEKISFIILILIAELLFSSFFQEASFAKIGKS